MCVCVCVCVYVCCLIDWVDTVNISHNIGATSYTMFANGLLRDSIGSREQQPTKRAFVAFRHGIIVKRISESPNGWISIIKNRGPTHHASN